MRSGRIDVNFIKEGTSEKDINFFLGPIEETDDNRFFNNTKIMAHLMAEAEVFTSVSEARRNGWNIPIPSGFSTFVVGKKRSKITVLNIID